MAFLIYNGLITTIIGACAYIAHKISSSKIKVNTINITEPNYCYATNSNGTFSLNHNIPLELSTYTLCGNYTFETCTLDISDPCGNYTFEPSTISCTKSEDFNQLYLVGNYIGTDKDVVILHATNYYHQFILSYGLLILLISCISRLVPNQILSATLLTILNTVGLDKLAHHHLAPFTGTKYIPLVGIVNILMAAYIQFY